MSTAYVSKISNMQIHSGTDLSFEYETPPDGITGKVAIWQSFEAQLDQEPVYKDDLPGESGTCQVKADSLDFEQDIYTVAVTAGPGLNTVGATQTLVMGQTGHGGASTLYVSNMSIDHIDTYFHNPQNVDAAAEITWVIVYEGDQLGQGRRVAENTSAPHQSKGLIKVSFAPGTLKNGQTYNAVLNPGNTTSTITAGYVFEYDL